jgi:DNA processing protein
MSDPRREACRECLRRSWLLAELSLMLDFRASDRSRLMDLLELEDRELIQALAGRRRAELSARHEQFVAAHPAGMNRSSSSSLCRHSSAYPEALQEVPLAPWMLWCSSRGLEGLAELSSDTAAVAIVGSPRPSDYGSEFARSLARDLASSGVTVVAALSDGIAAAALSGTADRPHGAIAVMGGGLASSGSGRERALRVRVEGRGCVVSELPPGCGGRRWGAVAGERTLALLADLVVVVEAESKVSDLGVATLAEKLGRQVAAVPGRVTSPLSGGTHGLLMEGARLVRGASDVFELLSLPIKCPEMPAVAGPIHLPEKLEPRLRGVLEQVAIGRDTPERLTGGGLGAHEVLAALSELELMGLLGRGDGGRYLARHLNA